MINTYLYLENYSYLNVNKKYALIKNTLSGYAYLTNKANEVKLLTDLYYSNTATIIVDFEKYKSMINSIRNSFSGDIIDAEKAPVQISNVLPVKSRLKIKPDRNIFDNLQEITIFIISNYNKKIKNELFEEQYDYLMSNKKDEYLYLDQILTHLHSSSENKHKQINICGGNILQHPQITEIVDTLHREAYNVKYHIHISQLDNKLSNNILKKMKEISIIFESDSTIGNKHDFSGYEKIEFVFFIKTPSHFNNIEKHLSLYPRVDYKIIPLIDDIASFFEYKLNIETANLYNEPIDIANIILSSTYNLNQFSKIFIYPDNTVLGGKIRTQTESLSKTTIKEAVSHELNDEDSQWRFIRTKVEPCKNCIFVALCPPISNYEISLNKYNLCDFHSHINYFLNNE